MVQKEVPSGGLNSRDTVKAVLPGSDVQRRVSMNVGSLQVTMGIEEELRDIRAARKCCPVEAYVLFLECKIT